MLLGIAFIVVAVLASIGEWYIYDQSLWWHGEKRDPRNFPPRRAMPFLEVAAGALVGGGASLTTTLLVESRRQKGEMLKEEQHQSAK